VTSREHTREREVRLWAVLAHGQVAGTRVSALPTIVRVIAEAAARIVTTGETGGSAVAITGSYAAVPPCWSRRPSRCHRSTFVPPVLTVPPALVIPPALVVPPVGLVPPVLTIPPALVIPPAQRTAGRLGATRADGSTRAGDSAQSQRYRRSAWCHPR